MGGPKPRLGMHCSNRGEISWPAIQAVLSMQHPGSREMLAACQLIYWWSMNPK